MQLPILFAIKFDMGPQQCGLNFLSMLVGWVVPIIHLLSLERFFSNFRTGTDKLLL
jgi:hypothetical protein